MEYVNFGLLVLIAGFFVKNFLAPYSGEKAKNLATKEDIGSITDRIESVKTDYARGIEQLRSSLQIASNQAISVQDSHRDALLAFFDTALVLLFDKLQTRFGDMPYDSGKSLWEYQVATNKLFTDLYLGYHRLLVFSKPGAPYLHAAHALLTTTFSMAADFRSRISDLKRAIVEEELAHTAGDRTAYAAAADKTDKAGERFAAAIGPPRIQALAEFGTYMKALNEHLHADFAGPLPNLLK